MEINETKPIHVVQPCSMNKKSSFRKNYNGVLMHTISGFKKGSGVNVIGSSE